MTAVLIDLSVLSSSVVISYGHADITWEFPFYFRFGFTFQNQTVEIMETQPEEGSEMWRQKEMEDEDEEGGDVSREKRRVGARAKRVFLVIRLDAHT